MDITFNKYEKRGAYHWKEFNQNTAYRKHALIVQQWISSGRTLDIGAGDGLITSLIDAEGIDDNETAVKLAKEKGVNVILGDAYGMPYKKNIFDNVLMGDVIEHLKYPAKVIDQIKKVLKPKGRLYIVTPPKGGKMDKYHYKEYTPEELQQYIENFGFKTMNVTVRPELKRMYLEFQLI